MPLRPDRSLCFLLLLLSGFATTTAATTLTVRGPLTSIWDLQRDGGQAVAGPIAGLRVRLQIPADAPADLGIGAWCSDRHGRWFQSLHERSLAAGEHEITFPFAVDTLSSEPWPDAWRPDLGERIHRSGLLFWTTSDRACRIRLEQVVPLPRPPSGGASQPPRLTDLVGPALNSNGHWQGQTGQRLEWRCRPERWPADPYDNERFQLNLLVGRPDGVTERIAAFLQVPMHLVDRGDDVQDLPDGPPRYVVRYRPRWPGAYELALEVTQADRTRLIALPACQVDGPVWDDYIRVDADDPRFFSTGRDTGASRHFWPIGLNIRSVNDTRSSRNQNFHSRLTPTRGLFAYLAYLERFAAAGGTAAEIWMSSWNLALEWRADWPGYHGLGAYHQGNAAALDRILDRAAELGVRINLVIYNHGMASHRTDREWHDSPFNTALGGMAKESVEFFTHPDALRMQERLRRYIVARYADHPAILGWKLFSEINLTAAKGTVRYGWFVAAVERWRSLDVYGHPCTVHWAGDYKRPDHSICAAPQADYLCIDAYHGRKRGRKGKILAQLISDGILDPDQGLGRYDKPVLVTEFGGSSKGCPEPQLIAEHRSGPWAALISGNAGSPMLWWWEWVDQHGHWQPYTGISRFLAGEDLRSRPDAASFAARLQATDDRGRRLWSGAWVRSGRLLGYCADRQWLRVGGPIDSSDSLEIWVGDRIAAGELVVQWWDPDSGRVIAERSIQHPGGKLTLTGPGCAEHRAFKLWRE